MIVYVIVKYLANAGSCGQVDERTPRLLTELYGIVQSLSTSYRIRF